MIYFSWQQVLKTIAMLLNHVFFTYLKVQKAQVTFREYFHITRQNYWMKLNFFNWNIINNSALPLNQSISYKMNFSVIVLSGRQFEFKKSFLQLYKLRLFIINASKAAEATGVSHFKDEEWIFLTINATSSSLNPPSYPHTLTKTTSRLLFFHGSRGLWSKQRRLRVLICHRFPH